MSKQSPRIVYMGTPGFAVAPLKLLLESECHVVGVITAPDRPAGRGKKLRSSEVKNFVLEQNHQIPILQPENLRDPAFIEKLVALKPELQVVVAFRMLPEVVWRIPSLGTINLHASLLPQYRGAAPINHVLMNGESETGVTTFFIDEHIDTGLILLQERIAIGANETAGELHDRLMEPGSALVLETVRKLAAGQLKARPQNLYLDSETVLKKAPKIFREDCRINWTMPGESIFNLIRGLSPFPGAFTSLEKIGGDKVQCKIFSCTFEAGTPGEEAGILKSDGRQKLEVVLPDGILHIHSIQLEGKRRMEIKDFLAGFSLRNGVYRFS